jgi:hypothetical protein
VSPLINIAQNGMQEAEARWVCMLPSSGSFPQVRSYPLRCVALLCCAVLCCAVLCCAVLCCAVLCCAVLCVLSPQVPCARSCGEEYCSEACRDAAWHQHHCLMCVEGPPGSTSSSSSAGGSSSSSKRGLSVAKGSSRGAGR